MERPKVAGRTEYSRLFCAMPEVLVAGEIVVIPTNKLNSKTTEKKNVGRKDHTTKAKRKLRISNEGVKKRRGNVVAYKPADECLGALSFVMVPRLEARKVFRMFLVAAS